ncbi:MAG: transposase [Gammaproteobacteria bacterium]|nr:transposase [Gammaproteobacteria bacterium]
MKNDKLPWAYFLTYRTYNTWRHGDDRFSVDLKHNIFGAPKISPNPRLEQAMKLAASDEELILTIPQRNTVLKSIVETCKYNNWNLMAVNVLINHVHIVLQSELSSQKTMGKIKCYGTKDLKKFHSELYGREHFWARSGSTKNIWQPEGVFQRLYYVVRGQENSSVLYYDKEFYDRFDEKLYEAYFTK